jgi:hypothetical protein
MIAKRQVDHDCSEAPVKCDLTIHILEKLQIDQDGSLVPADRQVNHDRSVAPVECALTMRLLFSRIKTC